MPYFERLDDHRFRATDAVGGAWDLGQQHVAPALGLLVHAVELDLDRRRGGDLQVARLSYDILGTMPVDTVELAVCVARPGRTIELVEGVLRHRDRDVVRLRAWLLQPSDTGGRAGTALPRLGPPGELPRWDPTTVWEGGFIASVEVRRELEQPGRARYWVRTRLPLVETEPVSDLARFVGLLDVANGMAVRAEPSEVAFPNVDLTAHVFGRPRGEWAGFDTTVSFGDAGIGLTSSVIHDADGPVGTVAQSLTLRPRGRAG